MDVPQLGCWFAWVNCADSEKGRGVERQRPGAKVKEAMILTDPSQRLVVVVAAFACTE